jgi:hypothetical protein
MIGDRFLPHDLCRRGAIRPARDRGGANRPGPEHATSTPTPFATATRRGMLRG